MCGERGVVVRVVPSTKPAPNTSHEIEHAGFHNPHDKFAASQCTATCRYVAKGYEDYHWI